ncbi:hypothetical protein AX14_008454, partial [Amanita brunnescens Koide BX004]
RGCCTLPYHPAAAQATIQWLSAVSKEGWNYVGNKGEVGQLRTASGNKTSQILPPRHAKVLLPSGEMTSDNNVALSSSSRDLDDQIRELALRLMNEKRAQRKEKEKLKVPAICWSDWYWDLTIRFTSRTGTLDLMPQNRIAPLEKLPFVPFERTGYTAETSKHASSLTFSNPVDSTLSSSSRFSVPQVVS